MEKNFVLRTKRIDSYFTGRLVKYDGEWQVVCINYAGGKPPILDVLDFRTKTKKEMNEKLSRFKAKYKLISRP